MDWLSSLAIISLSAGITCAITIAVALFSHPQHMWIMNAVWPITALYSGPLGLWAYARAGRLAARKEVQKAKKEGKENPSKEKPFWQSVGIGATHCGSGCTLGDIFAEWGVFFFPLVLFGRPLFASWVVDYILAFVFGIAFQYFTIKPMRNYPVGKGLIAALKADSLSLSAWQIGMYGWMAVAVFLIFGHEIPKTSPVLWFMMQIAMLFGFLTSYPVNWWLLRKGIKETM